MDYGTNSSKGLRLGMPMAPQVKFKDNQKPKLGDAPGRHPLFRLHPSVTILGAIFLFATCYVFCLDCLV